MKYLFVLFIIITYDVSLLGQSFEFMPGHQRFFMDAQFLKSFDTDYKWSLFSRARATSEYKKGQTDVFSAAYLNRTLKSGLGASFVGRISSSSSGFDLGIHYFKTTKNWIIFMLPATALQSELQLSWFSIIRFSPKWNEKWASYNSLEIFSAFRQMEGKQLQHGISVQRIRIGVDYLGFQFGLAANLTQFGSNFDVTDENLGIFIRKQFKN